MITPKDKAPTPVEQAPAPLVSDERMRAYNGDQLMDPEDVRDEYESDRAKMRAERDELVGALQKAVADYMWSEGCSCCQNVKAHEKAEARLAELLKPDAYEDGSGWDWGKYKTE